MGVSQKALVTVPYLLDAEKRKNVYNIWLILHQIYSFLSVNKGARSIMNTYMHPDSISMIKITSTKSMAKRVE